MSRAFISRRVALIGAAMSLVVFATASSVQAQMAAGNSGRHRHAKNGPKSHLVPMHLLTKTAGFTVYTLPSTEYILMASEMVTLPAGFGGVVKKAQPAVLLTYGWKKGGITRIYESPSISGVAPTALATKIADAGIFHDVDRRKGWFLAVYAAPGVAVVPTSADKKVADAAAKAIGR